MSIYIEKDKVLKIVNDMTECEDDYERITEWVHNMPSIDIVRCKECKFKYIYEDETSFYCCALEDRANRQWSIDETDYCSWGEREGE